MKSSDNPSRKSSSPRPSGSKQLTPGAVSRTPQHGTERAFTGPYWNEKSSGIYSLRLLRRAVVLVRYQVRFRYWLAELLGAGREDRGQRAHRPFVLHEPHGGPLRVLRRTSRPRLSGWPEADRRALLHERHCAEFAPRGVRRRKSSYELCLDVSAQFGDRAKAHGPLRNLRLDRAVGVERIGHPIDDAGLEDRGRRASPRHQRGEGAWRAMWRGSAGRRFGGESAALRCSRRLRSTAALRQRVAL